MNLIQTLEKKLSEENKWEKTISYERNEIITFQNSIDTNLYFIENGSVRIFIEDEDSEHTIRFGYKNNFITALDSFISEKPTNFTIQALKKSNLKVISKENYIAWMHSSTELQELWNVLLQQLILQQLEREQDLLIKSPLERYKRVLDRSPILFQEIPHKFIANYLRMSPETLSRLKKY
ncbi:Crp/Fnr family transcriptional regulator [Aureivirga sp. CE67]|uniref:Crp/Fnr family transcriptional regulator n=1 Tax=Aureivirga sp. CE67 TaxID=1788983 RepID=UPI0018CBD3C2|nr:Crp/Fnr family transcriptional regulator [Aureivirga sp. CE67]